MDVEMEIKKPPRQSFDGHGHGSASPAGPSTGPSALRRLTRSPSHRLSRRRNSTSSIRSASTSASSVSSCPSIASDDSTDEAPSSCVTRDTARDECALHRFIVWAAVKRNDCSKMTPEERRECPLLRCRKRFPNHELMLQHLYGCEQLAVGEYWCYECEKVERFSDAKCKRCLGHPSKRRRIMSLAKNFFSSLGHKSKNPSLADLDLDIDEAPPSYDSLLGAQQAQVELFSNEIHEIDSSEIQLPTIPEDEDEAEPDLVPDAAGLGPTPDLTPLPVPMPVSMPMQLGIPTHSQFQTTTPCVRPVELESPPLFNDSLVNWSPLPDTVAPTNLLIQAENKSPDRPVLQVQTHGFEYNRVQQKRRSKNLAPSSSVRSTASTSSTNSTNSTTSYNSTASYNISPMSQWSSAWHRDPGFESTLTSPSDDLVSPGGLFPSDAFANSCKASMMDGSGAFDNGASDSYLSELPADIPMLDALPTTSVPLHGTLALDQSVFFDASVPADLSAELSLESNLALTDSSSSMPPPPPEMPQLQPEVPVTSHANPQTLIRHARETLELHITESMDRLQRISKNHLVNQLRSLPPQTIVNNGLDALTEILEGRRPKSPVNILCFIHLVYSFSFVIFQEEAASRCKDLFGQALSYSSWFDSRQDRRAYIHIVESLWKPADMSQDEMAEILFAKNSPAVSRSGSLKGKERESAARTQPKEDSLAFVAQYFLDELEYAAIQTTDQPEIMSSQIYMQHLQDKNMDIRTDSPFALAVNFMLKFISQQHPDSPKFVTWIQDLQQRVNSNHISTTRRLELELIIAGKMCLGSDEFFDTYIGQVRGHVNPLYQNVPLLNSRALYYRQGIQLIRNIGRSAKTPTTPTKGKEVAQPESALDAIDDFTDLDGFDFSTVSNFTANHVSPSQASITPQQSLGFPVSDTATFIDPSTLNNPTFLLTPEGSSTVGGPSTAATSPPSPVPQPPPPPAPSKIESNSSCEICGYRPKGDPRWFPGSMAKHKKLQHATTPPKIYRCPFPGCTSQYKNRPDNLRQHQIEKGHFVDGQGETSRRPHKRKKTTDQ